jgi:Flp pilus assembly protein TadG
MRICLILLLAGVVGCAGESLKGRDFVAETDADVAALTARGTAHSLATAALLSSVKTALQSRDHAQPEAQTTAQKPTQAQALMKQAVALAEDQQPLAYLQWRACADSCADQEQIRIHLQTLDPDNGLVWLPELIAASETGDAYAVTRAIARIGAARRMSMYSNALVVMTVDELGENAQSAGGAVIEKDPIARMISAMGLSLRFIPPLQSLSKPCHADQFDQPGRREACEAMTARMTESDTLLMQGLGIGIQEKWWPDGSPEREKLRAQHRQLDYVGRATSPFRILHMKKDWAERLDALRHSSREIDAQRMMLAFYHLPLERPVNWKDPYSS